MNFIFTLNTPTQDEGVKKTWFHLFAYNCIVQKRKISRPWDPKDAQQQRKTYKNGTSERTLTKRGIRQPPPWLQRIWSRFGNPSMLKLHNAITYNACERVSSSASPSLRGHQAARDELKFFISRVVYFLRTPHLSLKTPRLGVRTSSKLNILGKVSLHFPMP